MSVWLENSAIGVWTRESPSIWAYPTVLTLHTIGLGMLVGANAIIVGDITIGSDVLIGAGAVVARSVPEHSRVTSARPEVSERCPSAAAAEPGSRRHLSDPYSIWR